MTLVTPTSVNPNDDINDSSVNTPVNQLAAVINGNIDDTNISSVSGSKISGGTIATASLADGSVTFAKTSGIWWEELGRTTLATAGDAIVVSSIPAKKYLRILVNTTITGGNESTSIRFNNDSSTNYSIRQSANGTADATGASQSALILFGSSTANSVFLHLEFLNVTAQEKIGFIDSIQNSNGAGNAPVRTENVAKWANTSSQITRVDVLNTGTGDYAVGSEVVVLGHN